MSPPVAVSPIRILPSGSCPSDNPRTEDPAAIRSEILEAVPDASEIGDRRQAIETAIAGLKSGDVLLIAGKGHEDYQIVGTTKHHFSDHEVVLQTLKRM